MLCAVSVVPKINSRKKGEEQTDFSPTLWCKRGPLTQEVNLQKKEVCLKSFKPFIFKLDLKLGLVYHKIKWRASLFYICCVLSTKKRYFIK